MAAVYPVRREPGNPPDLCNPVRNPAGAAAPDAGLVRLGDHVLRAEDRAGALRADIGYIPEDRQVDGFVPLLGAAENIVMTITDRIARFSFVGTRRREARAAPLTRRLSLVSAGLGQPVRELSGGNQQKVTVVRALASDPVLIVAITPTRGVDVASKELLLSELDRITAETGASLLLASVVRQTVTRVDVARITMQFFG